jgi:hypothetical protein
MTNIISEDNLDVEVDIDGYGGSYQLYISFSNIICTATFGVSVSDGSTVLGSNLQMSGGNTTFELLDSKVRFSNSYFTTGVYDGTSNRIVYPTDAVFSNCTFESVETGTEGNNSLYTITVYFNTSGTTYSDQRLIFDGCKFLVGTTTEASDTRRGIDVVGELTANNNKIIVNDTEFIGAYDDAIRINQGGYADIKGVTFIDSVRAIFAVSATSYTVDLTLHDLTVEGITEYLYLNGISGVVVRTSSTMMDEALNVITDGGTIGTASFIGGRDIYGAAAPTVNDDCLDGDIWHLKDSLSAGGNMFICTTTNTSGSAVWTAL